MLKANSNISLKGDEYQQTNLTEIFYYIFMSLNIIGCLITILFFSMYKRKSGYHKLLWSKIVMYCCIYCIIKLVLWIIGFAVSNELEPNKRPKGIAYVGYLQLGVSLGINIIFLLVQSLLFVTLQNSYSQTLQKKILKRVHLTVIICPLLITIIIFIAAPLGEAFGDDAIAKGLVWFDFGPGFLDNKKAVWKSVYWFNLWNVLTSLTSIGMWIAALVIRNKEKKKRLIETKKRIQLRAAVSRDSSNTSFSFSDSYFGNILEDEDELEFRYAELETKYEKTIDVQAKEQLKQQKKLVQGTIEIVMTRAISYQFINFPLVFIIFTILTLISNYSVSLIKNEKVSTGLFCFFWMFAMPCWLYPLIFIYPVCKTDKLKTIKSKKNQKRRKMNNII